MAGMRAMWGRRVEDEGRGEGEGLGEGGREGVAWLIWKFFLGEGGGRGWKRFS